MESAIQVYGVHHTNSQSGDLYVVVYTVLLAALNLDPPGGSREARGGTGMPGPMSSISMLTVPVVCPSPMAEVLSLSLSLPMFPYPCSLSPSMLAPLPAGFRGLARFRGHGEDGRKDRCAECPSSHANSLATDAREAISNRLPESTS